MGDPAIYEIEVLGQIGERWEQWFEDLTVRLDDAPGALAKTVLTGPVADQAALLGLLQKLYTLGLPLLLVRRRQRPAAAEIEG